MLAPTIRCSDRFQSVGIPTSLVDAQNRTALRLSRAPMARTALTARARKVGRTQSRPTIGISRQYIHRR